MALAVKNFVGNVDIGGALGTLWTVTSGAQDVIQQFAICNHTASAQTVTIYKVPPAVTANQTNIVVSALSVSPNTAMVIREMINQVMDAGGSVQAVASLSGSISVNASGMRQT